MKCLANGSMTAALISVGFCAGAQAEPAGTPPTAAPYAPEPATKPAAATPPAWAPPPYQVLRFNEDWSTLKARPADGPTDFFDPIKHIPLNHDGSIWASFGGQLRLRFESWDGFNFGAPGGGDNEDAFVMTRFLFHTDLHIGQHVRVFAEGKSAVTTDRDLLGGNRTLDNDHLDLQNGFVDVMFPLFDTTKVTLRSGRQELLFGKQRLVSPLDWANVRRTFDAVSGIVKCGDWTFTPFWSQPVIVQKHDFNDFFDGDQDFFGLHATGKIPALAAGIDLYYYGLDKDATTFNGLTTSATAFNGTAGAEERHTLGGRLWGKIGASDFDYDVEGAYQFGEVGAGDVSAFMVASQLGYTFTQVGGKPRLFVGFDYASGDKETGGDVETFNQLFPLGHAYFGWIDQVGRQNIIDFSVGFTIKPVAALTIDLQLHYFLRAEDTDALYNAGGGVARAPGVGLSDEIGTEIDLLIKYQIDRHMEVSFGYSHLFAGDFISESGPDEDIDFVYVAFQFTF